MFINIMSKPPCFWLHTKQKAKRKPFYLSKTSIYREKWTGHSAFPFSTKTPLGDLSQPGKALETEKVKNAQTKR